MYALHPGSLPPHSPKATERLDVSASDLMALYGVSAEDCIVWDPTDKYDWFDFIHLYPSYYERYTLRPNGTPERDVPEDSSLNIDAQRTPCETKTRSSKTASSTERNAISPSVTRCAKTKR